VDQNSIIRALAFVLGVVLILELGWGTYQAVTIAQTDFSNVETVETLDTDVALANTIDSLEANWARRLSYHFNVDQDPLFLGRVVMGFTYGTQGFKEFDEGGVPRLSATVAVNNESPVAIIKYMGKSYVLRTGDTFGDGYEVRSIDKEEVVLRKNGKPLTLHNQPLGGQFNEQYQNSPRFSREF
jgi:hypothetical protein